MLINGKTFAERKLMGMRKLQVENAIHFRKVLKDVVYTREGCLRESYRTQAKAKYIQEKYMASCCGLSVYAYRKKKRIEKTKEIEKIKE